MSKTILIVDDEAGILTTLAGVLTDEGYRVTTAQNGTEALRLIKEEPPSLVLLDIWMPGQDGIETLTRIKKDCPNLPVVMMSGHGSIETAVRATKLGAYDYIEKPLSLDKVTRLVHHALYQQQLEVENQNLKQTLERHLVMVGESPSIRRLREMIKTAGGSNSRVLISGENGTGKELVARAIHFHSGRADRPFVEINCAAIPDPLIESELFGHERGAFTGAAAMKPGRFELAHGATLFLDEIGDMSLSTQAKVLRVLQEQRFNRVGGTRTIEVDVRVIAASNKNLQDEIKKGAFREDLFYRLNVIPLSVPPLRERKEDIPLLVGHFLKELSAEQGLKPKSITDAAVDILMQYDWPGNVRELKNLIERLMIMVPGATITEDDVANSLVDPIPVENAASDETSDRRSLREARAAFERRFILRRLKENDWNISKTADDLRIERTHLHRKIKLLGLQENSPD
ncbi:MAG: sigma-54-dependent Fis family transcriptional regulator [Nitrospirae bacterium]|nr:sigma-54-dependent Fis family transcriptional regulator [Nitrospirota bacterium]